MKAAAGITKTHNPFNEDYWASCLRENLTSSSYGEGLETGRECTQEPRQSFTRQLFFKWIKQHLRVKTFYGTSANAVKTQIWVAMIVYLLLAILKERYRLEQTLSQLLHFLEVNIFEQKSMLSIFQMNSRSTQKAEMVDKQLRLFDL